MTDLTDSEVLSAASDGRLAPSDWGTALLHPGGAYTGTTRRVSAARIAELRPLLQRMGRLYGLTDAGITFLKEHHS